MNKIEIEIPEGKRAEWINGVLTLVDESKVEFKFNIGDNVRNVIFPRFEYIVKERCYTKGKIIYMLKSEFGETILSEEHLEFIPQDITERIKTFEDACDVLGESNRLVQDYQELDAVDLDSPDILAYLQLRIITCALNEGWWPKFEMGESRWVVAYDIQYKKFDFYPFSHFTASSNELFYKTKELAKYAAKQFADTYADFFGIKKGGKV